LKGFLWRPADRGPFPAVAFNHGRSDTPRQHTLELGQTLEQAAQILGPVFVKHGSYSCIHFAVAKGPDEGQFIGDLLQREQLAKGLEARRQLQLVLMTTDHLQDAVAALSFLKNLPYVDKRRVAVAGHSFGGQLTLLEAAHDRTVRAAVTFGDHAVIPREFQRVRQQIPEHLLKPVVGIAAKEGHRRARRAHWHHGRPRAQELEAMRTTPFAPSVPLTPCAEHAG
jgi:dienelactone hydrolase